MLPLPLCTRLLTSFSFPPPSSPPPPPEGPPGPLGSVICAPSLFLGCCLGGALLFVLLWFAASPLGGALVFPTSGQVSGCAALHFVFVTVGRSNQDFRLCGPAGGTLLPGTTPHGIA